MNYYSDEIINRVVDTSDIEDLLDAIECFYKDAETLFCYFSFMIINISYTISLIRNPKNNMAFLCMDMDNFNMSNCPSAMIYTKEKYNGENVYYILMICTKQRFKNMGYASMLLTQFIDKLRSKHSHFKIILSSLDSAVTYYEKYGFKWTRDDIRKYPKLLQTEKYEEGKEYFIMELNVGM